MDGLYKCGSRRSVEAIARDVFASDAVDAIMRYSVQLYCEQLVNNM